MIFVKSDRMGLTVKWPQPHFRRQTQGDEVGWETHKQTRAKTPKYFSLFFTNKTLIQLRNKQQMKGEEVEEK